MGITYLEFLRDRLSFDTAALAPRRVVGMMRLVWQVRRERNQLANLSRSELAEMGIHPGDAMREVERGLLDLPKSRLDRLC